MDFQQKQPTPLSNELQQPLTAADLKIVDGNPGEQPAVVPMQSTIKIGDIHAMPEKFSTGQRAHLPTTAASSGKRTGVLIAVLVLVLGGLTAGAYFYFQSPNNIFTGSPRVKQPPANTNQATPDNTTPVVNTNQPTTDIEAVTRDSQRVTDLLEIAKALDTYYKQFGSYPQFLSTIPESILPKLPTDPTSKAVYTYTAKNSRQSYGVVFDIEERGQLNDESLTKGSWEFAPEDFVKNGVGNQNSNTNIVTNTNTTDPNANQAPGNLDIDGDGLTAAEEKVFTTSADSQDSDSDGFKDNIEITNFYSPVQTGAIRLDQAGLVKLSVSATNGFSFYYPANWLVSSAPTDLTELLITTGEGEDFSIQTHENPSSQTSWDWYVQNVSSDFDRSHVTFIKVAGYEAVRTLDGLKVYLAVGTRVYTIIYNLNSVKTINYPTIFQFILDRFTVTS